MFKKITITNIASVYLVLFCIQFIPIEGYGVDYLKFTAMALAPLFIFVKSPKFSKASYWCIAYFLSVLFSFVMNGGYFRISSIMFTVMFLVMYAMFYNLVYDGAFTLNYFIKIIQYMILAYAICLLLQQVSCLVGIHYFPLINLVSKNANQLGKLNSLSLEPSSAARTLACLFFALIKSTEIKIGYAPTLKQLYKMYKWVIIGFFWSMLTMGSGTAFVCLMILGLYFVKRQYVNFLVCSFLFIIMVLPALHIEQLNRVLRVIDAVPTLDNEKIIAADGSAATRILPIVNTLHNFDLLSDIFWFGKGLNKKTDTINYYSSETMLGCISSFGFFAYLMSCGIVFGCAIRRFRSIPTLMHFVGVGGAVTNIQYHWGLLMIWTVLYYFIEKHHYIHGNNK